MFNAVLKNSKLIGLLRLENNLEVILILLYLRIPRPGDIHSLNPPETKCAGSQILYHV